MRKARLPLLAGLLLGALLGWTAAKRFAAPEMPAGLTPPVISSPTDGRAAAGAAEFWVEARVADAKEYRLGHWLALNFPIASPQTRDCKRLLMKESGILYAKLVPSPQKGTLPSGPVTVWTAETCAAAPGKDGLWVRGDIQPSKWLFRASLNYGIERYFVADTPPPVNPKAKDVRMLARVTQDPSGRLKLLELSPFKDVK